MGLAIAGVVSFELVNSAVERLATKVAPGADADIRWAKDAAAAVVIGARMLLTRMVAFVVAPPA